MPNQRFGGPWTDIKQNVLGKYLRAYTLIFARNPKASYYRTVYIDAFAGSGFRAARQKKAVPLQGLFIDIKQREQEARKGSAMLALELPNKFDKYLFIERKPKYAQSLRNAIRSNHQDLLGRCTIREGDANELLQRWCRDQDWHRQRGVVFLDPYGMDVEWNTIRVIARTKALDMWVLVPLGIGINRLLQKDRMPGPAWSKRLTRFFGTESWKTFYSTFTPRTLFEDEAEVTRRIARSADIARYTIDRFKTEFSAVLEPPLVLRNSTNSPMFLLCFAVGNPAGEKAGLKIARDIIGGPIGPI